MIRSNIARLLREGYDGPAWHGPNLRRALSGLDPAEALWRPGAGRHNVWEIVLHCAYWKHRVASRMTGARTSFAREGKDWPHLPQQTDAAALRADLALLATTHSALTDAAAVADLRRAAGRGRVAADQLVGIALHDIYHAGQIRLVRRMYASSIAGSRKGRS